jgi:hypothetical protein
LREIAGLIGADVLLLPSTSGTPAVAVAIEAMLTGKCPLHPW